MLAQISEARLYSGREMGRSYTEFITVDARGHLVVEGQDCLDLAQRFGTPLFVISEAQLRANARSLRRAFSSRYPRSEILFSNKANLNPAVRRILSQEGIGGDCFGYTELYLSLLGDADPKLLLLNGSNKAEPEVELAVQAGVTINLDAVEEVELVARIARKLGRRASVSLRTRLMLSALDDVVADFPPGGPHVGPAARAHKFGMHYEDVLETARLVLARGECLRLVGLQHHAGRWIADPLLFQTIVRESVEWAARLRDAVGWTPAHLDFGGGLAWGRPEGHGPGGNDTGWPDYDAYAEVIVETLRTELVRYGLPEPVLMVEPGRALACSAGVLLSQVGTVKTWPGVKTWVNVDTSQNHLPNILTSGWYFHAVAAANADPADAELAPVDLVGPLCSVDLMGGDRRMPPLRHGDVVAFLDAGAYGESKAANFNAQPRPATVLVCGDQVDVITERETMHEVIGRFRMPARFLLPRAEPAHVEAVPV
jgi:diaminopimelate decarboxylase